MDSTEKRSLKKTNTRQFQILAGLMEKNLRLARCMAISGREKLTAEETWDKIAQEVNLYGPPERTASEWKKIWGDLKSRTKKKIYEHKKYLSNCGQGSAPILSLSELEQSVDRIFQFSTMVVADEKEKSQNETSFDDDFNDLLESYEVKSETGVEIITPTVTQQEKPTPYIKKNIFKIAKKRKLLTHAPSVGKSKSDKLDMQFKLLQQQVQTQEKMFKAMKIQAAATKSLAEATSRQAEALSTIADSTKALTVAMQEALKYLKQD